MDKESEKIKLPLILEGKPLPTDKYNISYSELVEWQDCSWRHKLHQIDKVDLDKPTEHTEYGGIIHDAIEKYLTDDVPLNAEETGKLVVEKLSTIPDFKEEPAVWGASVGPIFEELPGFLKENFQNFKVHSAEHELQEIFEKKPNRYFKGFIDCVLEFDYIDKRKKDPVVERKYYILDWKTTAWGWTGDKKRDPQKQMQLVLYKHFWAKKHNIPLDKIKCAWVLLKRTAKPGQHIELVPVSVGEKSIERALDSVYRMLGTVEKQIFVKNRNSCKYCPYNLTEHCP